ncbi:protein FAM90A24-like [Rhynchonycteris naso]
MAGLSTQRESCRPLMAQRGKKQQRAPVAHKTLRPEEEDPRVKCGNCGAFGHKANSVRCPMKRWGGAVAPQPLGPKEMKENRKPQTPRDLRTARPPNSAAGETETRSRDEEQQRQALLQRFPRRPPGRPSFSFKGQTETCDYIRRPTRPTPVHTTHRTRVADPSLNSESPTRIPDVTTQIIQHPATLGVSQDPKLSVLKAPSKRATQTSTQTSQNLPKKPRLGPCFSPQKRSQGPDTADPQTARPPAHPPRVRPAEKPEDLSLTPAQVQHPGPPPREGHLLSIAAACHGSQVTPRPHVPGQPLRMVFMRSDRGLWSSRFITAPSGENTAPPGEYTAPPRHSLPVPDEGEGPCTQVPLSVLYEDLWVSSSSEESDGQ